MKNNILKKGKDLKIDHLYYKLDKWEKIRKKFKHVLLFGIYLSMVIIIIEISNSKMIKKAFAKNLTKSYLKQNTNDLKFNFYYSIIGDYEITKHTIKYSEMNDIDTSLLFAIMKVESEFNRNAVGINTNGSIDRGLCQLNDQTFTHIQPDEFFDPEINIQNGAKFLKWCLIKSNNNLVKALAYYNAGIGSVSRKKVGEHTLNYINSVISEKKNIDNEFSKLNEQNK
ncbi:MAG: lytic transglycosylase domain-containing protein [Spirochaetes bacterium]|nr:lytic transglycosylase domain-containing protein [Spirochaetota bacterium]